MAVLEMYNGTYLWKYIPSMPAAVIFIVLFSITTLAHGWKLATKRLMFCFPFFVGGIFEIVGYVGRALAHNNTGKLIPYVMQSLLLLLAPIFFAATLYMTYSRIVRAVDGESCSIIPLRWATRVFVCGDVASFFIQGGGGAILSKATTQSKVNLGNDVIVAGLVFQVVMFATFLVCCVTFNMRFRRTAATNNTRGFANEIPWQSCLVVLYVTSVAIMIRNIYRVIEYAMGSSGYLLMNEWPTYVFDAALMVITMAIFFVYYPSTLEAEKRESMMELTGSRGGESSDANTPYKNYGRS